MSQINALWEGMQLGIVLCFLIGPIFFTLIQTGIEDGFRAGLMVCLGIWASDFLFIGAVYGGFSYARELAEGEAFKQITGVLGASILLVYGFAALFSPMKQLKMDSRQTSPRTYGRWWLRGFLVNTVNPFTFFFWIGTASSTLSSAKGEQSYLLLFFAGIMFVVMLTDALKVYFAKKIRERLQVSHILFLRRVAGVSLLAFGVILLYRVF